MDHYHGRITKLVMGHYHGRTVAAAAAAAATPGRAAAPRSHARSGNSAIRGALEGGRWRNWPD